MAIYGATLYQSNKNETDIRYDVIGKDSEAFATGDIVTADGGVLDVVDNATDAIAGVIVKADTMTSSNTATAKVHPGYIPSDAETVWLMGCNASLTGDQTDYGKFFGLTGATSLQQVDVTTGVTTTTSRQVMIVKVDPNNVGGTAGLRQCLVKFFRTPSLNF